MLLAVKSSEACCPSFLCLVLGRREHYAIHYAIREHFLFLKASGFTGAQSTASYYRGQSSDSYCQQWLGGLGFFFASLHVSIVPEFFSDPCALFLSTSGLYAVCSPMTLYASPTAFVQDFSRFILYKCNTTLHPCLLCCPSSLAVYLSHQKKLQTSCMYSQGQSQKKETAKRVCTPDASQAKNGFISHVVQVCTSWQPRLQSAGRSAGWAASTFPSPPCRPGLPIQAPTQAPRQVEP